MANKDAKGRPPVENPATRTLGGVRVSERQLQEYKDAAKRKGKSFSEWVRSILDRAADK